MAEQPVATPLVLRPTDPTARKGAMLFGLLAAIGVIGLVIEAITGNVVGAIVAAIIAIAGAALASVVVIGRSTLRVVLDEQYLHIAGRRVARSAITGLRRRPIREGGLDVMGEDGTVLYAMPAWFDQMQERQLAAALGVSIVEPPPPAEDVEEAPAAEADDQPAGATEEDATA